MHYIFTHTHTHTQRAYSHSSCLFALEQTQFFFRCMCSTVRSYVRAYACNIFFCVCVCAATDEKAFSPGLLRKDQLHAAWLAQALETWKSTRSVFIHDANLRECVCEVGALVCTRTHVRQTRRWGGCGCGRPHSLIHADIHSAPSTAAQFVHEYPRALINGCIMACINTRSSNICEHSILIYEHASPSESQKREKWFESMM